MLGRLFSDVRYHLTEMYEDFKFRASLPDASYPLGISDVPDLADKIHELHLQHALAKEARQILRRR